MALGRTVARVSALVSPDTTKFARELRAALARIRERVEVKVTPDLDTTRLRAQLAALRNATIELNADVNTEKVRAKIKAIRGLSVDVQVDADLTRFRTQLAAATRQATANVRVEPDLARFRREMASATRRRPMRIDVTGNFTPFLSRLRAVTRNRSITLNVHLDTAGAMARFRVLWAQMRTYALARPIPLRFDIDRNYVQQAITRMFSGITMPNLGSLFGGAGGSGGAGGLNGMSGAASRLLAVFSALGPVIGTVYRALGILFIALEGVRLFVNLSKVLGDLLGLLGFLPALLLAAGAGIGVLAAGFLGLKAGVGAAKEVTDAFKSLAGAGRDLRDSISNALFADLAAPLRDLGTSVLPTLKTGLTGIATEMNRAARGVLDFVRSDSAIRDMATGLSNTRALFAGLADAAINIGKAFADIAFVGSEFFPALGAAISKATGKFAAFIAEARNSGRLKEWMQKGVNTFAALWRILGNVKDAITGLFDATGADEFLPKLEAATQAIADFIKSPEGSDSLKAMFDGIAAGVDAIITALADGDLPGTLRNIGIMFHGMGVVIGGVIDLLQWLAEACVTVYTAIGDFVLGAINLFAALYATVSTALQIITDAFTNFQAVVSTVFEMFQVVVTVALTAVMAAFLWFQGFIAATIAFVTGVFTTFSAITAAVWAMIVGVIAGATAAVVGLIQGMAAQAQAIWSALHSVTSSIVNAMRSVVQSVVQAMVAFVQGQISRLPGIAQQGFGGFLAAAASLLGQAVNVARSTVSAIIGAFSGLAGALRSAGANAMNGFIAGFQSAAARALAVVRSLASQIAAAASNALEINSPSRVFMRIGRSVGEGLALGMLQSRNMVNDAATKTALSAVTQPQIPSGTAAGVGVGDGVNVVIEGNVGWDPAETARRIATQQRDALVMAGYAQMAVI